MNTLDHIRRLAVQLQKDPGDEGAREAMMQALERGGTALELPTFAFRVKHLEGDDDLVHVTSRPGYYLKTVSPSGVTLKAISHARMRELNVAEAANEAKKPPRIIINNYGFLTPEDAARDVARAQGAQPPQDIGIRGRIFEGLMRRVLGFNNRPNEGDNDS